MCVCLCVCYARKMYYRMYIFLASSKVTRVTGDRNIDSTHSILSKADVRLAGVHSTTLSSHGHDTVPWTACCAMHNKQGDSTPPYNKHCMARPNRDYFLIALALRRIRIVSPVTTFLLYYLYIVYEYRFGGKCGGIRHSSTL